MRAVQPDQELAVTVPEVSPQRCHGWGDGRMHDTGTGL